MNKFIIFLLIVCCVSLAMRLIDTEYYLYCYYRVLNGSEIPNSEAGLSKGFYFMKKPRKEDKYHPVHGQHVLIPLSIISKIEIPFSELLKKDLVSLYSKLDRCTVYLSNKHPNNIYFDFDGIIGATGYVKVDEIHTGDIQIICGMIEERSNKSIGSEI